MKINGLNPDNTKRAELDGILRAHIQKALGREEVSVEEVAFLLVRAAVELEADDGLLRGQVLGNIVGAYALRGVDIDGVIDQLTKFKEEMGRG